MAHIDTTEPLNEAHKRFGGWSVEKESFLKDFFAR
jgi:hypothetical protein